MWPMLTVSIALFLGPGTPLGGDLGFEEHVQALQAAADARSDDPEPALRLAQGYGFRGETKQALRWLKVARERGVDPLRGQMVEGDIYLGAENYEFALRAYFEVATVAPHNGHAHLQLWRVLRGADILPPNVDQARLRRTLREAGYFIPDRRVSKPDRRMARQLSDRAYTALKAGKFQEAESGFEAALTSDDRYAAAYRGLGITFARQQQPDRALAAYRLYLLMTDRDDRDTRQARRILSDAARRRGLAQERKRPKP